MQHQQELSADKRADGPQRMALVFLVSFDAEAVVVAEVHGKNVIRHVWHAVPDDKVCRQPVPEKKKSTHFSEDLQKFTFNLSVYFHDTHSRSKNKDMSPLSNNIFAV